MHTCGNGHYDSGCCDSRNSSHEKIHKLPDTATTTCKSSPRLCWMPSGWWSLWWWWLLLFVGISLLAMDCQRHVKEQIQDITTCMHELLLSSQSSHSALSSSLEWNAAVNAQPEEEEEEKKAEERKQQNQNQQEQTLQDMQQQQQDEFLHRLHTKIVADETVYAQRATLRAQYMDHLARTQDQEVVQMQRKASMAAAKQDEFEHQNITADMKRQQALLLRLHQVQMQREATRRGGGTSSDSRHSGVCQWTVVSPICRVLSLSSLLFLTTDQEEREEWHLQGQLDEEALHLQKDWMALERQNRTVLLEQQAAVALQRQANQSHVTADFLWQQAHQWRLQAATTTMIDKDPAATAAMHNQSIVERQYNLTDLRAQQEQEQQDQQQQQLRNNYLDTNEQDSSNDDSSSSSNSSTSMESSWKNAKDHLVRAYWYAMAASVCAVLSAVYFAIRLCRFLTTVLLPSLLPGNKEHGSGTSCKCDLSSWRLIVNLALMCIVGYHVLRFLLFGTLQKYPSSVSNMTARILFLALTLSLIYRIVIPCIPRPGTTLRCRVCRKHPQERDEEDQQDTVVVASDRNCCLTFVCLWILAFFQLVLILTLVALLTASLFSLSGGGGGPTAARHEHGDGRHASPTLWAMSLVVDLPPVTVLGLVLVAFFFVCNVVCKASDESAARDQQQEQQDKGTVAVAKEGKHSCSWTGELLKDVESNSIVCEHSPLLTKDGDGSSATRNALLRMELGRGRRNACEEWNAYRFSLPGWFHWNDHDDDDDENCSRGSCITGDKSFPKNVDWELEFTILQILLELALFVSMIAIVQDCVPFLWKHPATTAQSAVMACLAATPSLTALIWMGHAVDAETRRLLVQSGGNRRRRRRVVAAV